MKQDIKLYINNNLVEFTKPFEILYNYKITDLTKPTAVKNSYTNNIQLDDTTINNDIFKNIWNLEKITDTTFNANKKVPFVLYLNNEIYEKGYVKLNHIKKVNNRYQYDITLFGGLGELFYNLSSEKKTLADLEYTNKHGEVLDLSFNINKDTIFDAWNSIIFNANGYYDEVNVNRPKSYLYHSKWETINFMPAYEGIPSTNFSPDTLLINTVDYDMVKSSNGYKDINGYALGTANEDLTCNMTNDYRSYLQRPVIRMKSIINACQNPINNGGWELKLDDYFFHKNNPYYEKTFVTLNRLIDNEKSSNVSITLDNGVLVKGEDNVYDINFGEVDLSNFSNAEIDLQILYNNISNSDASATRGKLYTTFDYTFNKTNKNKHNTYYKYKYNGCYCIQVVAYDENGNVVTASDTHVLGTQSSSSLTSLFKKGLDKWNKTGIPTNNIKTHEGYFNYLSPQKYLWYDNNGDNVFKFSFVNDVKFYTLKVRTMWVSETYTKTRNGLWDWSESTKGQTNDKVYLWGNKTISTDENFDNELTVIYRLGNRHNGEYDLDLIKSSATRTEYNNFFSNTYFTPQDYLNTDKTPADYLISYCKMFGLYFWHNPKEIASDTDKYPKGVMHILTRDKFYNLTMVHDLTNILDKGREFEITPYVLDQKYYTLDIEQVGTELSSEYNKKYGEDYGIKKYETEFEFNESTENLLNGSVFKSGIEAVEIDKYFTQRDEKNYPAYYYNGFSYELFKENSDGELDSTDIEIEVQKKSLGNINNNDIKFGDSFSKMQFHSKDNDSINDGNNVLVFFNGSSIADEVNNSYYITDDLPEMYSLNDEIPCFIMTCSEKNKRGDYIAYKVNELPKFGRYKCDEVNNMVYSLDMGNPKMTYIKNKYITPNMSISSNVYDKYIGDLKDKDNKILKCYINFNKYPDAYTLRDLYYYNNSFWILNEVRNWNIINHEPVECELVKVMDRYNYRTNKISYIPPTIIGIEGEKPTKTVKDKDVNMTRYYYNIPKDKLSFNLNIFNEDNLIEWQFSDYFYVQDFSTGQTREEPFDYYTDSEQYNFGSKKVKIRLPYNEYKQIFQFTVINSEDNYRYQIVIETDGMIYS